MIGDIVTHYRILDKVGEGGMGVVYRAEDTRLGRQVALKFVSTRLAADPMALERFQREARAASSLNHPHICTIYDIGRHNDLPFMVMELLSGTTLRRRIGGSPLPLDTLIDLATQAADALDAAHALGIVHRDIKSPNIFVTDRGQVKVLDFGLAKLTERSDAADPFAATTMAPAVQATETGQALGTLSSMSPEQARGEDLDCRSDLFSFGVVLYEMATGREPFPGATSAVVFDAILNRAPVRPTEINPAVPPELEHIILKALEKDRDLRYQTAAELRADLRRLKRETGSGATRLATGAAVLASPTAVTATAGSFAAPRRWPVPRLAAAAGLVVLVAALAGGFWWWRLTSRAIDSVAVLPFAAPGAAADTEYLTDGVTETLINGQAQLPGLRVIARSVVFRYKNRAEDPQQIGRDLNVRALVTGRATVRGDRVIIQAEMMDVSNGSQLWGGQYNQPSRDLVDVQEQIANEILDTLRPRLSGEEKKRVTRRYTDDSAAYQIYLQGRYHWNKGTIAGYKNAIEYFQQAIARDPKYALAYAGLADSYLMLGSYWVEALPEAKAAALEAIELDSSLSEAHVALGHIKLSLDWDWAAAEREFKQGIDLSPASALAHDQYAMYLGTMNRLPEGIAEARRALEIDPLSPIVNSDLGWLFLFSGQTGDAIAQFRRTLEFDANSVSAHRGLGVAESAEGRHADAIAELQRAVDLSEGSPVVLGQLGAAYAHMGNRAEADRTLKQLDAMAARQYVPSSAPAAIYVALGNTAQALDSLERAYDEHDFSIVQLRVAPWFQPLRNEPRFRQLLSRVGLLN
jgi:TolB-like protein/Flp pilus assembly protein TadD